VASQIVSNPSSAITLLSKNLPKASNFYISYFILYGLANASRYLFNLMGLVGVFILSKFAKTPRKKYMRYVSFTEPSWGAEYPKWTNLGVIALSYACIAPLVLGFATVGIGCIYLAYRYNMIYVHDTHIDTKGGFYARALEQLMVGVYLGELCLLGLFGIGIGNSVVSAGPTVLQVVLIVATVIFHIIMKRKIKKMNLLDDSHHPRQQNDTEAGRASEGNSMHPGYSNVSNAPRNNSRQSDSALVSTFSDGDRQHRGAEAVGMAPPSGAQPQRSMLKKIFSPHTASASEISSSLTTHFRHPVPAYTKQDVLEAYLHPALAQREEVIWLARDQAGVSKSEVSELTESLGTYGVEVTDEGAVMNEKGKVEWDDNSVRQAPLWDHKVVY
jgi:signal recognition particle receptor subunit alpha